ncbi:dTDP-4-dehydrorhamnose reductase [Pseudomonas nitroreducens]|uniref:dTDP-4-dehydrorhamnose reductase n=1 Tax=Pseudomonas TaxID=286 RepID=UPI0007EE511B|nr:MULTISPECIES: dTDP-4-dehydrorhamnose reductase [Pseudomonas]MDG9856355.1 dTDP-4-dehydrorhamnose reductase [Pseudomonas nitroreducens]MDH1073723.1 dTDP-4-dehydrorhamnose reductase [Pseudomonas nitroreducens]NMZ71625.1 dTDP-4-dehydrorhamnose reductase [Pseudomonas nitroreducens]OBY55828.1 dTDP-4-dehydrorhamnose reductase [Pseudomonas sp. AU12215]UCL86717.1 dTDP-4-dehydrorhamnose reductase [Pseudomonas sp. HS-18]
MKKILLLGANGQVGWELQRSLAPIAQLVVCDRQRADLADVDSLSRLLTEEKPDVIVNAGAYTAVDKAESDYVTAHKINAEAVDILARYARKSNSWLVHYSTDYVFDGGSDKPFDEETEPAPVNAYGRSKLEGEIAIRESGCRHLIFRTSWVFALRGNNFAKTILRLAKERNELRVIADQFGAPTSAELIADVTAQILQRLSSDVDLQQTASGTYHLVASGETSWHQYAQLVVAEALNLGCSLQASSERVVPITTADYPLPAKRPQNSRLANAKLQRTFGLVLPDWTIHLRRMVQELVEQEKK